jgi:uncharacterized membrane protein YcgQ (UPF0703/DUF1980 family)
MKQINFKQIKVEIEIGNFQPQDFRKAIGNTLFSQARNIEMDELSRRIYSSDGAIDIPDEQFSEMMTLLSEQLLYYRVKKAIEGSVINVEQKKEKEGKS